MVLSQKSQHCKYITESFEVSLPYHIPYCTIRRCTINPCAPSASALQKIRTLALYASALYIIQLYAHAHGLLTMVHTRSQKRKAEDSEPQDQAPVSTGNSSKVAFVKAFKGGKRPKVARDDDDQLTVPAPPVTVHRHHNLKKLIIRNKTSRNQSMYPMVIPVIFRGVQAEEPEDKPIEFTFRCELRPKCPDTKQNYLPTQQPATGTVQKKRIAPKPVQSDKQPARKK